LKLWPMRSTTGPVKHSGGEHRRKCLPTNYTQVHDTVLRRPIESALAAAISVQHHLLGELAAQRHRHRHRGLHQIGMQVLVKRPADHPPATAVTHRAEWRDLVALMSDGDPLGR
jgi:hypothetical protein